jgi:hypothetical protein
VGAGLDFGEAVVNALWFDPTQYYKRAILGKLSREEVIQRDEELERAWSTMQAVKELYLERHDTLSPAFQACILEGLATRRTEIERLIAPLKEARHRIGRAPEPLFAFLEKEKLRKEKLGVHCSPGQPSRDVASLFMVLLTDHLRQRTRPCHRDVGYVAERLFPEAFAMDRKTCKDDLAARVRDRCIDFRKRHDVPALRAALLATRPR